MTDSIDLARRYAKHRSPLLDLLGVTIELDEAGPQLCYRVQPEHLRSHHIVHGGVLCTLLDTALGATAYAAAAADLAERGQELVTLQLEVHFLRPAWDGEELRGRGTIVHHGRQTLVVRGEVTTLAGQPVVSGAGTFLPTEIAPAPKAG